MILKELSEAIGISSQESAVRKLVLDAIDGHAENIRIDALGGVTAVKPGHERRRQPAHYAGGAHGRNRLHGQGGRR